MRSTRKKKSAPVELAKKKRKVVVDLDEYSLEKKKKNKGKTGVASEEGDYHRKRSGEVDSGADKDKLFRFLQNLKSYQELMKKVSGPADVNASSLGTGPFKPKYVTSQDAILSLPPGRKVLYND